MKALLAVQAIVCLVLVVLVLTLSPHAKPCGNPAGIAGTLTTTDTHHGQRLTEDSPGWRQHCQ